MVELPAADFGDDKVNDGRNFQGLMKHSDYMKRKHDLQKGETGGAGSLHLPAWENAAGLSALVLCTLPASALTGRAAA